MAKKKKASGTPPASPSSPSHAADDATMASPPSTADAPTLAADGDSAVPDGSGLMAEIYNGLVVQATLCLEIQGLEAAADASIRDDLALRAATEALDAAGAERQRAMKATTSLRVLQMERGEAEVRRPRTHPLAAARLRCVSAASAPRTHPLAAAARAPRCTPPRRLPQAHQEEAETQRKRAAGLAAAARCSPPTSGGRASRRRAS